MKVKDTKEVKTKKGVKKETTRRSSKEKELSILEKITKELLSLMAVNAKLEIYEDKENEVYVVDIKPDTETGLLIGRRGETISSLQSILGIIYGQKVGEWKRIIVNISDWRQKQEERLRGLAEQAAERVKVTGEPQAIYNLSPSERRTVHLTLSSDSEVTTESVGEGEDRYLLVKPKT